MDFTILLSKIRQQNLLFYYTRKLLHFIRNLKNYPGNYESSNDKNTQSSHIIRQPHFNKIDKYGRKPPNKKTELGGERVRECPATASTREG